MNTVIKGWWRKLGWQCKSGELEECRAIWQDNTILDEVAQQLCTTRLQNPRIEIIRSVEQPAEAITQAPSVWALLDQPPANDALQWLLEKYLWGSLSSLKLLQTGETVPLEQDEEQPAHIRLQTLMNLTEQKRSKWIKDTNDILDKKTFKLVYDDWKDDYKAWMNESSQNEWYWVPDAEKRAWTSVRFRNFLFKICGNYHLVLFWLHVKASWSSLCIFKQVFAEEGPDVWKEEAKDKKLERAVQMVRDAA